jgi:endonuclease G
MNLRFDKRGFCLTTLLLISCTASCLKRDGSQRNQGPEPLRPGPQQIAEELPFGNPSDATTDASNRDNYLVIHSGYVLSYNDSRGTLNWVAWRTTRGDLGEKRERSLFRPDRSLPDEFRRIQYYDYSGSGYDRGHMVPE